jgi:hypothetical protein
MNADRLERTSLITAVLRIGDDVPVFSDFEHEDGGPITAEIYNGMTRESRTVVWDETEGTWKNE